MITLTKSELVDHARVIAEDFKQQGYDMTLRQVYYQCVKAVLIPNSDESYKRLGNALADARLAGEFDMDLIVDRGRTAGASKHHECKLDVDVALTEAGSYLKALPHWSISVDKWFGQPNHVSVWVEKDALSGVFKRPCDDLGVGFFACKGYPSHSALWQWIKALEDAYQTSQETIEDDEGNDLEVEPIQEAIVLYFGDHDPDGWQIPRSAEETLNTLVQVYGLDVPPIRFIRVALLMDQIRRYQPPPFPAKVTSSRYAGYFREHGIKDAWELDALSPKVLDALIRQNVAMYWDQQIHEQWQGLARTNRVLLRQKMREPQWVPSVLDA